jgi:dTDP-4-dehydrorhamnose reductase
MNIIGVTGWQGQLGAELIKRSGFVPIKGRFGEVEMIRSLNEVQPKVLVNCGAWTDVDGCERNTKRAFWDNTHAVEWLSDQWPDCHLVQISTDFIFSGSAGPYRVTDQPSPISIYGWSKWGGELLTVKHPGPFLIIRTTVLFSEAANNFVAKIIKQLRDGTKVALPAINGSPTYIPHLADEIERLISLQATGIAHIAGFRQMSRYQFAWHIAQTFGLDDDLLSERLYIQAPGTAERPLTAGLVSEHTGGIVIKNLDPLDGLRALAGRELAHLRGK